MSKELMMSKVKDFCQYEGIKSVKDFRRFFEYWVIGSGEMDDDFSFAAKRLSKTFSCSVWKKAYALLEDSDIESCLATEEEAKEAEAEYKERMEFLKESELSKSAEEKKAETEVECQLRDAGIEYNNSMSWEDNLALYAINPEVKIEEVKKYTGYGYHGGGRPSKGEEARRKTISISGSPAEIETLKLLAEENGKNVSRFVLESLL